MKYATPLLGLAILVASVVTAAAAPQIPAQYHGEWCAISRHGKVPKENWVHMRCRDRYDNDLGGMQVRARWIDSLESRCTVTKVTALRVGHKVQSWCRHETGEEWPVNERWYLSADGRHLVSE